MLTITYLHQHKVELNNVVRTVKAAQSEKPSHISAESTVGRTAVEQNYQSFSG